MRMILGVLLLCPLLLAQDTRTQTLANGMKVIVQEDHGIPNVAMYFFYRIGSRNERPGHHRHLALLRAHDVQRREEVRAEEVRQRRWRTPAATTTPIPATTSPSTPTGIPRSALELMFDLEADRIRDLAFDPKIIESERGVVYSERRTSVDNSNFGMLSEQAAGRGLHGASVSLARGRLAVRHRVLDHGRPQEPLPHGLRPEQLHAGDGGRRHARPRD